MAAAMVSSSSGGRGKRTIGDSRNVVADNHKHCLDFEFEDIPEDAGFHHTCYRRFTDKKAMTKVERRLAREGDQDVREDLEVEPIPSSTHRSQTEKLRSRSGLPIAGSGPVLPAWCIICKMKEKMIIKAGKRQRDQLCKTETLSAGKLQKAAEKKDDQSVLLHIKDKDCVALEVRYNKSCYSQYTKFLLRPDKPETEQDEPMFDASYKLFCERIIRQRLLVNNEVLRMGQLRKAFIDMVKTNEGVDASNYRQDLLKKRLAQDFPQLAFHMPTKRNVCELVFAETLSKDALVDMLPDSSGSINGVLNGHHYNRSMRAHKLLYESLQRIRFITFMDSLPPQERAACMDFITEMAIEQTLNRDAKTKGGWTGITQNRSAVYRWILSQHERAAIARQCESMAGISPELRTRKDLDKTRISADAKA
ncbi:hypothetical protein JOQ06_005278, partial [Pogonophryne albipinna]